MLQKKSTKLTTWADSKTRWGMWLKATIFCAIYLEDTQQVICFFDSNDAALAIKLTQNVFWDVQFGQNLAFVKTYSETMDMKKLETINPINSY